MKKFLLLILVIGAFFRFFGINWDQNQHLHPDERFMTMVTQSISWPSSIPQFFDTRRSPANPHNIGYPFYVYGTLPLFTVKTASQLMSLDTYNGNTLVGRFISAGLDTLIIFLVFLITLHLLKKVLPAIFSALIYAAAVLPVQLAHFFAVDTFLVFFITLSFYSLIKLISSPKPFPLREAILLGVCFGCSLSSKITAALFLPIILVGFIYKLYLSKNIARVALISFLFALVAFISLRILQPYLFTGPINPNPQILDNWSQLKSFDNPDNAFPPAVQWIKTPAFTFPLTNLFLWGWGPVLGILVIFSSVFTFKYSKHYPLLPLVLIWIFELFIYQCLQFAKPMRYFYPIYPFLAIPAGFYLSLIWKKVNSLPLRIIILILILYWPISFISIYMRPHSRVQASAWISHNIPSGSTLSCEYWDDCLPLSGNGEYRIIQYPLYDPDTSSKWQDMENRLGETDYLILSSNRLYGSIASVPEKYPITSRFYADLFSGHLGFVKVAEFTSRPNIPVPGIKFCFTPPFVNYGQIVKSTQECSLPGISFVDDYADESWTVYDHPKVIIFQKAGDNIQSSLKY